MSDKLRHMPTLVTPELLVFRQERDEFDAIAKKIQEFANELLKDKFDLANSPLSDPTLTEIEKQSFWLNAKNPAFTALNNIGLRQVYNLENKLDVLYLAISIKLKNKGV